MKRFQTKSRVFEYATEDEAERRADAERADGREAAVRRSWKGWDCLSTVLRVRLWKQAAS